MTVTLPTQRGPEGGATQGRWAAPSHGTAGGSLSRGCQCLGAEDDSRWPVWFLSPSILGYSPAFQGWQYLTHVGGNWSDKLAPGRVSGQEDSIAAPVPSPTTAAMWGKFGGSPALGSAPETFAYTTPRCGISLMLHREGEPGPFRKPPSWLKDEWAY